METGALGRVYQSGEVIVREGQVGDCMYAIQEGFQASSGHAREKM